MRAALLSIAAALTVAALPDQAAAGANFDRFLNGLDHACKAPPAFDAFWKSIVGRYGYSEDGKKPKVVVPADLMAAFGPITATDKGQYVDVSIPLDGTFRELKLTRIAFFVGKENGISGYRVEFAETPARLKAVLGAAVAKGKKQMAAEDDAGTGMSTDFDFKKGAVAVYCDFSN
jgi:hypothetical protein